MLQLYRASVISEKEIDDLVDEIERLQKLHHEEVLMLKGEPIDPWPQFERCPQLSVRS